MNKSEFIALSAFGIEGLVADEIKELGFTDVKTENGKVHFTGDFSDLAKANIFLRCADRVLYKMTSFYAYTFDELFDNTKDFNWADFLPVDAQFPVARVSSRNSKLFSKSDCQAIVKKAVVESMKRKYKIQNFPENGDLYQIGISIENDLVTLYLDSSGSGLNKRGYRAVSNEAPIRETLAAAIIKLSKWTKSDLALLDPMCGSGTLLIEAAMMAKNIAPGIQRNFDAENWNFVEKKYWKKAREFAKSMEDPRNDFQIFGSDIDESAISIATANAKIIGVDGTIKFSKCDIKNLKSPAEKGIAVCNPPYGERMLSEEEAEDLFKLMGQIYKTEFTSWSWNIICAHPDFQYFFGKRADKNRKLYNGKLMCYLYQYIK